MKTNKISGRAGMDRYKVARAGALLLIYTLVFTFAFISLSNTLIVSAAEEVDGWSWGYHYLSVTEDDLANMKEIRDSKGEYYLEIDRVRYMYYAKDGNVLLQRVNDLEPLWVFRKATDNYVTADIMDRQIVQNQVASSLKDDNLNNQPIFKDFRDKIKGGDTAGAQKSLDNLYDAITSKDTGKLNTMINDPVLVAQLSDTNSPLFTDITNKLNERRKSLDSVNMLFSKEDLKERSYFNSYGNIQ